MDSRNEIAEEVGRKVTGHSEDWQNVTSECWEKANQPGTPMPAASAADQLPALVLTDREGEGRPGEHMQVDDRNSEIKHALGDLAAKNLTKYLFPEIAPYMEIGAFDLPRQATRDLKNQLIVGLTGAEAAKILQVGKTLAADNSRMIEGSLAASGVACLRRRTADGTIADAAIQLPGPADKLEVSLLIGTYRNVLAAVGTNRPVATFVGDVLPPLKGTVAEDNLKNAISILSQFTLPALDAELQSKE